MYMYVYLVAEDEKNKLFFLESHRTGPENQWLQNVWYSLPILDIRISYSLLVYIAYGAWFIIKLITNLHPRFGFSGMLAQINCLHIAYNTLIIKLIINLHPRFFFFFGNVGLDQLSAHRL